MAYRFFVVPVHDEGSAIAELNGFVRSHRVLSVDRRWVDQGTESFWSFCVDYLERVAGGGADWQGQCHEPGEGRLSRGAEPEDFAVFARLRQMRKEISQAEAVPVYTVFTNEQLAQMVRTRATTKAGAGKDRRGRRRADRKYGPRFLEVLGKQVGPEARAGCGGQTCLSRWSTARTCGSPCTRRSAASARKATRDSSSRAWTRIWIGCGRLCAAVTSRWESYHQFTIFDPKERLITAPCFRERVLHHAVINVCEPVFERWLIVDTFACRGVRAGSPPRAGPGPSPAGFLSFSSSTSGNILTASPIRF